MMLLLFYWLIDVRGRRKWSFPLVVIGMNSIFIYMFTSLYPVGQTVGVFTHGIADRLGSLGPFFQAFSVVLVEWLILFWMYRRRIFIKA
jgi:predicted acyltransferase